MRRPDRATRPRPAVCLDGAVPATFWNPSRRPLPVAERGPSPRAFHRRLPGYAPTPLVDVPSIATELGLGRVWVKDESVRLGLPAFKVLGASWATYRLVVERLGAEPTWDEVDQVRAAVAPLRPLELVTATDGNHGRAVARAARLLGLGARIFLPAGSAEARIEAIASEGAAVTVVEGDYDAAVAHAASLAGPRSVVVSDTSWPGYAQIPTWVAEGYRTLFEEVDEQVAAAGGAPIDAVVVQTGVGALAVAAVHHLRRHELASAPGDGDRRGGGASDELADGRSAPGGALIAVVEPDSAGCVAASARAGHRVTVPGPHPSIMAGLNCGTVSEIAWPVLSAGVDAFVTVDDAQAEAAMRSLAELGVVAGETGGSGLAGLRQLVADAGGRLDRSSSVLVLNTEGATDPDAYERIVGVAAPPPPRLPDGTPPATPGPIARP
jgi:diaminopropionate ammonia-lyase